MSKFACRRSSMLLLGLVALAVLGALIMPASSSAKRASAHIEMDVANPESAQLKPFGKRSGVYPQARGSESLLQAEQALSLGLTATGGGLTHWLSGFASLNGLAASLGPANSVCKSGALAAGDPTFRRAGTTISPCNFFDNVTTHLFFL